MPTYAYACTECEHRFDIVQSFSDDALTECPECGGRLRKLFNAVGVVFKGGGFYRTDSRSADKSGSGSGGTSSGGSGSGSSSGDSSSAGSSSTSPSTGAASSGASSTPKVPSGASSTKD
ncbi:FmdB family transcriptional regulator [Nostocoides sp. F2B08]|uniref:FmdB family zinc ribbon protein n=1 Tax=Nostocoides sp. F2B08 TaxID=2653936 RepID=UPI001263CF08|nr:FmdB family zinc ribbon protein [Tetrasphaera sp. F2B08]KAB7743467.1 FmdB family transcriptional regulator [Tetrasphaera sp. F2B08]